MEKKKKTLPWVNQEAAKPLKSANELHEACRIGAHQVVWSYRGSDCQQGGNVVNLCSGGCACNVPIVPLIKQESEGQSVRVYVGLKGAWMPPQIIPLKTRTWHLANKHRVKKRSFEMERVSKNFVRVIVCPGSMMPWVKVIDPRTMLRNLKIDQ